MVITDIVITDLKGSGAIIGKSLMIVFNENLMRHFGYELAPRSSINFTTILDPVSKILPSVFKTEISCPRPK